MEVLYLGASVRTGTSAKSGRPYSIGEVLYAIPDESREKRNPDNSILWTYTAHGLREMKIDLDPGAINQFKDCKPCSRIVLKIEPVPENPSRNRVIGVV